MEQTTQKRKSKLRAGLFNLSLAAFGIGALNSIFFLSPSHEEIEEMETAHLADNNHYVVCVDHEGQTWEFNDASGFSFQSIDPLIARIEIKSADQETQEIIISQPIGCLHDWRHVTDYQEQSAGDYDLIVHVSDQEAISLTGLSVNDNSYGSSYILDRFSNPLISVYAENASAVTGRRSNQLSYTRAKNL